MKPRKWLILLLGVCVFPTQGGGPAMALDLNSPAFDPNQTIPRKYSCDGPDLSPPLKWAGVPAETKTFALIVDDPDAPAGAWVHWVVYDLPGDARSLPEGVPTTETLPRGGVQGKNDFSRIGYGGPCPPPGRPHRYVFTLYALNSRVNLAPGAKKQELLQAMKGHVLDEAELIGVYGR